MTASTTQCASCRREERRIGTRCWRCYVLLLGRKNGVARRKWWVMHLERIQTMLFARYTVATLGVELPPVDRFLTSIWTTDPRPLWLAHKHGTPARARMLKIVATVERRAKEDRDAASDCSAQEGR